jgi:ABC-type transport system involved in cytochrome c biogenesis permease subunit
MKNEEKKWQKWVPWVVAIVMALWVIGGVKDKKVKSEFNINEFAKLPVLLNGRIQPMDSVARNTLLVLRGKGTVLLTDKPQEELGFFDLAKVPTMSATEWLLETMTRPTEADKRYIFRIDNGEVLALLKLPAERKYFSFNELRDGVDEVETQADRILKRTKDKEELRTPFEKGLMKLQFGLNLYFRVKNSLRPQNTGSFADELQGFQASLAPAAAALKQKEAGQQHNEQDLQLVMQYMERYKMLAKIGYPMVIPPEDPKENPDGWMTIGGSLMDARIEPPVWAYVKLGDAYAENQPGDFNASLVEYKNWLAHNFPKQVSKGAQETFFNHYEPFVKSISIYLLAFLFGCAFWFNLAPWLRRTSVYLALLALILHTSGLIFRMHLEGRPPVTNLYSSAIFVGWGAVVLGCMLERFWQDGIGVVTASAIGVITLIIAHNLALGGDTMEMLRAVLDTNFWLATHVVVITLGYASMFLAGALATKYVLRGVLTTNLSQKAAKAVPRMVYGILCFATLFSFVGTILGGIWADQSWGRFWGWDPKENGALLIVIWCAVVLHARWGGMIRERGLMAMCLFGNIVTSFSWFGVNMLGVGLHSYGFMDQAFKWLVFYDCLQVVFIGMALLPLRYWRSFSVPEASKPKPAGLSGAKPAAAYLIPIVVLIGLYFLFQAVS